MTHDEVRALRTKLAKARKRIKYLESVLCCIHCDHLQHEHEKDGGPCQGGRTATMEPGEGEYCECPGFESADGAA